MGELRKRSDFGEIHQSQLFNLTDLVYDEFERNNGFDKNIYERLSDSNEIKNKLNHNENSVNELKKMVRIYVEFQCRVFLLLRGSKNQDGLLFDVIYFMEIIVLCLVQDIQYI